MVARLPNTESDTAVADGPGADVIDLPVDDEPGDDLVFVKSGITRVHLGDQRYRLRRPFFGELRTLRGAIQDVWDERDERSDKLTDLGRKLEAEMQAIPDDDPERGRKARAVRRKSTKAAREFTDWVEDAYLAWWGQVFDLLGIDGRPEDWPAWFANQDTILRVLAHWRADPLARG